ncbi:Acyl-CoA dehydrogenase, short-chain specific [Methylobrevis pamukkalensis]|uniref:Acyl-CoA dehydrogenase, short-chain specific n=1 Tax=Methylobrevis pamukkalensis TaxID=1439726 RepID=A0A1E3H090_9HYPH|nr:Acyl-CoA dehydrogenase, short-chain specific [Methylobrevis pamukkalensis]
MSPIVAHPDVRRMLMRMRSLTDAARAIAYSLAHAIDRQHDAGAGEAQVDWAQRAALLTPVAKAFATDVGFEVASLGVQVHGGMGYIEETGAARHLRDARIFQIYEGTNGIQAIDLVTRKLGLGDGLAFKALVDDLRSMIADAQAEDPSLAPACEPATAAIGELVFAANWLTRAASEGRQEDLLSGATAFLRLFAIAAGGALLLKAAGIEVDAPAAELRRASAHAFAVDELPHAAALRIAVIQGGRMLGPVTPSVLALMQES